MKYIKLMAITGFMAVLCLVACKNFAKSSTEALTKVENKSQPKTEKPIPQAKLLELQGFFKRSNATNQAEFSKKMRSQMIEALTLGSKLEKEYPKTKEIHQIRMLILQASFFLNQAEKDNSKYAKQLTDLAGRILKSQAPLNQKVIADFLLTQQAVKTATLSDDREKKTRAYINKYAKTTAAIDAYVFATRITISTKQYALTDTLADEMTKKFPNDRQVKSFLKNALGREPSYGKVFTANLPRLDGSKLILPKDLKGKVVVIDFWATWCGPCRATIPHLKKVYDKYKSKGVEVVGISLDNSRRDLDDYIKEMDMTWIITYSGKGWNDPTSRKYGITGIPSLWVLGKDGKVFSTNARGDLEGTIERALKAKVK